MSKREEVVWFILNHPELVAKMDQVLRDLETLPVEALTYSKHA